MKSCVEPLGMLTEEASRDTKMILCQTWTRSKYLEAGDLYFDDICYKEVPVDVS